MSHGGRGEPQRAAKHTAERKGDEDQGKAFTRASASFRNRPSPHFGITHAFASRSSNVRGYGLPNRFVTGQRTRPSAKVFNRRGILVLQVPAATTNLLLIVQKQQVPDLLVFSRPVSSVGGQLLGAYRPVLEIYAPSETLHLADECFVSCCVNRETGEALRNDCLRRSK